jgi:hypothetical protein
MHQISITKIEDLPEPLKKQVPNSGSNTEEFSIPLKEKGKKVKGTVSSEDNFCSEDRRRSRAIRQQGLILQ